MNPFSQQLSWLNKNALGLSLIGGAITFGLTSLWFLFQFVSTVYNTRSDVADIKPKIDWIVQKIEQTSGEKYTASLSK